MLDVQHLSIVYGAYVVAAGSPGPSNMRIMGVAMDRGRRAALTLALGVVTGSVFWGLMAAMGVAAMLAHYIAALVALKIFGGLYLLYLAWKAGRSALSADRLQAAQPGSQRGYVSPVALYRRGLLMHLSNPKSILSWIALVTLGLGPKASWQDALLILGGCACLSLIVFCGYAIAFSTEPMVRFYTGARRWIEGALAALFAVAGLRLITSRL